jgi:hypothetical protein
MKRLYVLLFFLFIKLMTATSQENLVGIEEALPQIEKGEYKGTFINDSLVAQFLEEYLFEAKNRGLDLNGPLKNINWILIEPESNQPPELTGMILGKIDKDRNLILLSKLCLLDRHMLKATLFRELSHYFGLPYNLECCEIMRVNKPKGYSYVWFDDVDIKQIVYDDLFTALKRVTN